jgi:hypothetical protein
MPRFTHDFSRDLTPDETKRLADICDVMFNTFEWEREQPVHVCEQVHGGKVITTRSEKDITGQTFTINNHQFAAICHDCGRGLIRPQGGESDTWMCPSVHNHPMRALKMDHAVECGRS